MNILKILTWILLNMSNWFIAMIGNKSFWQQDSISENYNPFQNPMLVLLVRVPSKINDQTSNRNKCRIEIMNDLKIGKAVIHVVHTQSDSDFRVFNI